VPSLIPRLASLCFAGNKYKVSPSFVEAFVKIHRDSRKDDDAWRIAQQHWERAVEMVLNTDAIAPDADGDRAVRDAVVATANALNPIAEQGRCPLCPAPALSRPDQDIEGERAA
jgi:hypothetical protein